MAFVRDHNCAAPGDYCDLPCAVAADAVWASIEPRLQCTGPAAVRRVAPRDALPVSGGAHPTVPVPVLEHGGPQQALRVPAPDLPRRHRRAGQGASGSCGGSNNSEAQFSSSGIARLSLQARAGPAVLRLRGCSPHAVHGACLTSERHSVLRNRSCDGELGLALGLPSLLQLSAFAGCC